MAERVASRVGSDPRRRIAELIEEGLSATASVRQLSRAWGIAERSLWRILAESREGVAKRGGGCGPGPRPGPRPPSPEALALVQTRVLEVLERVGWKVGEATVVKELAGALSLRLVRRVLKELKAARRRRIEAAKVARRFSFQALAQGAVWCLDEAQLAARCRPRALVFVQLIRDPSTRLTGASVLSPPATGVAAVAWLEHLIETLGSCPLVLSTDNGAAFTSVVFEAFLEEHQIIHLKNLPHTPEHNTHAERGVKDLKQALQIPKGRLAVACEGLGQGIRDACHYLNGVLRRGVLGGLTAAESAAQLPLAEVLVDRSEFFEETRAAIAAAVQGCSSARARRLAERKAIFETLARFNLISITRGGKDAADLNTDKTR